MPPTRPIQLSDSQRTSLQTLLRKGSHSARTLRRAQTLLLAEQGYSNNAIATLVGVHPNTVGQTRRRFSDEGLESALHDRPRSGPALKLDAQQQAHLIALACSDPPEGRQRWTLRLLASQLVELSIVEDISYGTVRTYLKKTPSNPGRSSSGAFPP